MKKPCACDDTELSSLVRSLVRSLVLALVSKGVLHCMTHALEEPDEEEGENSLSVADSNEWLLLLPFPFSFFLSLLHFLHSSFLVVNTNNWEEIMSQFSFLN